MVRPNNWTHTQGSPTRSTGSSAHSSTGFANPEFPSPLSGLQRPRFDVGMATTARRCNSAEGGSGCRLMRCVGRSWSFVDFILLWVGGAVGTGVFYAIGVRLGDDDTLLLMGFAGMYIGYLAVFGILYRVKKQPSVGFEVHSRDLGFVALGLILQIAIASVLTPLSELLFPDGQQPQEISDAIAGADTVAAQVGLVLAAVVLAPAFEELLFRGVLLRALEPRGKRFALVVSALLWTAEHLSGLDVEMFWQAAAVTLPAFFLLGLVLGWLTQRRGRLGPAIFLHSGWNLLAALVLLLPPDLLKQVN